MKFKKVVQGTNNFKICSYLAWTKNWVYFPTIFDQSEDLLEGGLKSSLFH